MVIATMPHSCVFGCNNPGVLHRFPNPNEYPERFKAWAAIVGKEIEMLPENEVYELKRICYIHFLPEHKTHNNRLSNVAVPLLHLPGSSNNRDIAVASPPSFASKPASKRVPAGSMAQSLDVTHQSPNIWFEQPSTSTSTAAISIVNKEIQYVTQEQDAKEVLGVDPCAVYDVASYQFLMDAHNSADVMSVPDQFILPESESNIFANNYLLPVPNCTEEQIDQHGDSIQYQEPQTQAENGVELQSQNQIDNYTEITLSDDQYQTLEQRGWILLETNDKVFVLDTYGLHDITSNDKLIQRLKSENETFERGNESLSNQQDTTQYVIQEDDMQLTEDVIQEDDSLLNNVEKVQCAEVSSPDAESLVNNNILDNADVLSFVKTSIKNNIFNVKTELFFKDIPNKVFLGETENGKRLCAKITKIDHNNINETIKISPVSMIRKAQKKHKTLVKKTNPRSKLTSIMENDQFVKLIRLALQNSGEVTCSPKDVESADGIIMQLIKVPTFKPSLINRNIFITKISVQSATNTVRKCGSPVLVTGRVIAQEDDTYNFVHIPDMLEELMNTSDDNLSNGTLQSNVNSKDKNISHVHITEIRRTDNVLRISVTLNKRRLPDNISPANNKRRQASMIFGCIGCGAVFQTENGLNEHQTTPCMDVDNVLTMDFKETTKEFRIEECDQRKFYCCKNCQPKNTELSNCEHLKTLLNGADEMSKGKNCKTGKIYRCKICSNIFPYSSSLSKHIVAKHLKINDN